MKPLMHGIYLGGIENARVTTNTFNLIHSAVADSCYGLYLDECTGYWIEENDFFGPTSVQKGFGIIVNRSGPYANEIYRNRFESVEYGINAQKENRDPSSDIGLRNKCNKLINCLSDISVTHANITGIAYRQGYYDDEDPSSPAGNWFSHLGGGSEPSDINNEGTWFQYFHHDPNENPVPVKPQFYSTSTIRLEQVYDLGYDDELSCPSCLETGGGSGRTGIRGNISNMDQKLDSTIAVLEQLIDGGDTEGLEDVVDYSLPSESMEVYNELMQNSPYLSDTVIEAAIYKEDVLPNAMIRDIMVANPHTAETDSLIEKIDERWDPMPDYMKEDILQGVNSFTQREKLEAAKAGYQHRKSRAFNMLIRSFIEDTLLADLLIDSLINTYSTENVLNYQYNVAFLHAEKSMFQAGTNIVDSLPNKFILTPTQLEELDVFTDYYDFLKLGYQDTSQIFHYDNGEIVQLFDLELLDSRRISGFARNILIASGELEYQEPVFFPDPYKSEEDSSFEDISISRENRKCSLNVYPNPSRDYIIAEYSIENNSVKADIITIRDMRGKILYTETIYRSKDQLLIDTRNLTQGIYIISLLSAGEQTESAKFTITR